MNRNRPGRWILAALTCWLVWASLVAGQEVPKAEPDVEPPSEIGATPEDARVKQLTEEAKKKSEAEKPPFEIFRSQVAPFDVLPYVKANHWSTLTLELRANHQDYAGQLETAAVPLKGPPVAMVYSRDARLIKGQRSRLSLQMMMPEIPREVSLELTRPESVRFDERTLASLRVLEPYQMLVVILSREANDTFASWNRFRAFIPQTIRTTIDQDRYYRLVLPLEPDKPVLSPHPLTWSTISHVIWDGMSPEILSPAQQQAMLDWLHWGGQLVILGGAGPTFGPLRESFLAPYLPAEPAGENSTLDAEDLQALALEYPPVVPFEDPDDPQAEPRTLEELQDRYGRRYLNPEPIRPPSNRPIYLSVLRPKPGATPLTIGGRANRILGVEHRVGRGRLLMLGLSPTDPSLLAWTGLDTFVRRIILRRAEEPLLRGPLITPRGVEPAIYNALSAPELSWVRYLSRDMVGARPAIEKPAGRTGGYSDPYSRVQEKRRAASLSSLGPGVPGDLLAAEPGPSQRSVGDWDDQSALPSINRELLEEALGLSIPSSWFVLKVALAYVCTLVVNWLIWFVFRRPELAWAFVPVLSIGFAVGVERAAAFDLGYDASCDEIDLVETHAGYPRAHISRFGSLYSSARVDFSISYPDDPTALALPMDTGRSLRGEDLSRVVWQSNPFPALKRFRVQPRSYAMFRAEQMAEMTGSIRFVAEGGKQTVTNDLNLELRDAVLLGGQGGDETPIELGTIAPGETVEVGAPAPDSQARTSEPFDEDLRPTKVLDLVRTQLATRPEEKGARRLVAWIARPLEGQKIEPVPDRLRGFTVLVANLGFGSAPDPNLPMFDQAGNESPRPTGLEGGSQELAKLDSTDGPTIATSPDPATSIQDLQAPAPRRPHARSQAVP